jgi:hypothetical protein
MTPDPLDRYLDDFGRTLEDAARKRPRRARRPRRLPLLAGSAALAAAAITAVLLLLPGSTTPRRLDVIAEARAALAPQAGELTHLVVRQHAEVAPGARGVSVSAPPITIEQWSATGPVRWRMTYINPPNAFPHPEERVEVAYADGVETSYNRARNALRRVTGLGTHSAPAAYPLGTDPIATLRSMLAHGRLRDAGPATIGGRAVRRLLGTRTRALGKQRFTGTVEYDIDPTTFAPVRAKLQPPFPLLGANRIYEVLDFRRFERLPLTAATSELLKIHPDPGAKVRTIRSKRA